MKRCNVCNYVKPLTEFYFESDKKTLKPACKNCIISRTKKWQKDNPEQFKSNALQLKYGITLEEKVEMIKQQGNRCAICENVFQNDKATHVDHCHKTKDIRAVLCHHCNTGLGHFKDSKKLLQQAIHYIEHHAKQNTAAPVSKGSYIQGAVGAELGSVSTPWTWEDDDHTDHHCGTVRGEDLDHRAQEGGGDGVGRGGKEVAAPQAPQSVQDNGEPDAEIVRLDFGRRYLLD
jgi:uncharacterized protein YlaI